MRPVAPGTAHERLDELHGYILFFAGVEERAEGCRIGRIGRELPVPGKQDRIEIEPFEAPQVHRRSGFAMAGHAEKTDEPALFRLDERLERAVGAHRRIPFILADKHVHLPQVHVVGTHEAE